MPQITREVLKARSSETPDTETNPKASTFTGTDILKYGGGVITFLIVGAVLLLAIGTIAQILYPIALSLLVVAVIGLAALSVVYFFIRLFVDKGQTEQAQFQRRQLVGCVFLFALQIILLLVWGVFFLALGMALDTQQLPPEVGNLITAIGDFLKYLRVV